MTTVQLNKPKLNFILEDECEGMMAEDKNVLINAEQNKKKYYLPTELWDIVKSYTLYPSKVHKAIEIKCNQDLVLEWNSWTNIWRMSYCFPNLKKYIHRNNKKYNCDNDPYHPNFLRSDYKSFKKIIASRASSKTKDEALQVISYALKTASEKYKERKQYFYSNSQFAVSFRKVHTENDEQESPLPRWRGTYDKSYNDYIDACANQEVY
jgi:hypothetical protein